MENKYQVLLDKINSGYAILTAGRIHDDIPTIHDVGHSLKTDIPVNHMGFGFFESRVNGNSITFDAGGAMKREKDSEDNTLFSWTCLFADQSQLDSMGYDLIKVKSALKSFNI